MSVIALENLSVSHRQGYEQRTVVHDVNLRIEPGECFGLVGPSGCGKSSLLWVLAGLNDSWRGGFELLGRQLQPGQAFTGELRREVQMVFQDPYASLHPKHRLLRTLSEPLKLLQESDIERKIGAGFRQVGLDPRLLDRYPHQLSGGQRQRVAIVRALLLRPKLLLLDEPSLGLAPIVVRQIFGVLRELTRSGMTLFLVEQNANHALKLSDRGYVMVNGQIRLTGSGEELLNDPQVRKAYLGGG